MDISIIIPVWNEREKIANDIKAASVFLAENKLQGEIIVVDDGSADDTIKIVKEVTVPSGDIHVIKNEIHKGKGAAVRTGVLKSKGQFVMFADSGLCVPYSSALQGINLIKNKICEIAHGSRKLPESQIVLPQSIARKISARIFRNLITTWMNISKELTDTQCGFKIYQGEIARQLYSKSIIDGFMFDIEIILMAQKNNYKIKEFPIEWTADRDSRLSLAKTPWRMIAELRAIRLRLG